MSESVDIANIYLYKAPSVIHGTGLYSSGARSGEIICEYTGTVIPKSALSDVATFSGVATPSGEVAHSGEVACSGPATCSDINNKLPDATVVTCDSTYLYVMNNKYINGTSDAAYINDNVDLRRLNIDETREFFEQKILPRLPMKHNCEFVELSDRVFVRATADIAPGEELLIDYGFAYWFSQFIKKSLIDYGYSVTNYAF